MLEGGLAWQTYVPGSIEVTGQIAVALRLAILLGLVALFDH
jgi:hypothetical protein